VVRLARENDWGFERIEDEFTELGHTISHETVGNIPQPHDLLPAPERDRSPSWPHLMTHYKDQLLVCDFFTVETLFLRSLYVLVFVEIGSRQVHFAGCTAHPDNTWVTQQGRQVMWALDAREPNIRRLIRDNDRKFTPSFDTVFRSEGIDVILTPYRGPNANAFAARWIRFVREECLDKLLIITRRIYGVSCVTMWSSSTPHAPTRHRTTHSCSPNRSPTQWAGTPSQRFRWYHPRLPPRGCVGASILLRLISEQYEPQVR
jgi:putative transposase